LIILCISIKLAFLLEKISRRIQAGRAEEDYWVTDQTARSATTVFSTNLRAHRLANNDMTHQALAAAAGIEERHLVHYELGHTEPGFDALLRICRELGCTPNDLLLK
jgi:DNA-binding Xre family transcriptional regulator